MVTAEKPWLCLDDDVNSQSEVGSSEPDALGVEIFAEEVVVVFKVLGIDSREERKGVTKVGVTVGEGGVEMSGKDVGMVKSSMKNG
jgi:hypothetical protein